MARPYQICTRCIMDTTDPEIWFDDHGRCNHCTAAIKRMGDQLQTHEERELALERISETIRREGRGKDYDCIIGVSGGVDSTYTAWLVKKLGLRPLAVHFDNGWNSELAVANIKNTLDTLGIDLHTHVVDWEEFRDLQLCFLKASVPNAEIPTDHGIFALLPMTAKKYRVQFILIGSNVVTEAIMPYSWSHHSQDLRLIKALHRRYGHVPLKTLPTISLPDYFNYFVVGKLRQIPILNYTDYNKAAAKTIIQDALGWRDYGGKHYESVWTRFFQGYYLLEKFGFDKRRAHLSTLVCSNQMTRDEALERIKDDVYDPTLLKQDMQFVLKKFSLTPEEFDALLKAPLKRERDYPSHYFLFEKMQKYKDVFRAYVTRGA